ncbi:MAG: flagellar basal body protein FliL, partial [Acidimicrobiales bacterium]
MPEVAVLPLAPRRWGRVFLTIAAAVALVGAGTGTSLALSSSSPAGASTPAGAVSDLFTALGNSDVIGMLDAVAPGERDAIEPGLQNIFDQLKRLGILSSGADLGDLTG